MDRPFWLWMAVGLFGLALRLTFPDTSVWHDIGRSVSITAGTVILVRLYYGIGERDRST